MEMRNPESGNFLDARRAALPFRKEALHGVDFSTFAEPDAALTEYFFNLQSKVERAGNMDYTVYGKTAWHDLIDEHTVDGAGQHLFADRMVERLHHVPMEALVYPHVQEHMHQLIEHYRDRIAHIALWSTGDVSTTSLQLGKVDRSNIVLDFYRSLRDSFENEGMATKPPTDQAKLFLRQKTSFLVDDNKFSRLGNFLQHEFGMQGEEPMKLVIIEDVVENFDKASQIVASAKEGAGRVAKVSLVPIWVTYSREGQRAHAQAVQNGTEQEFSTFAQSVNAISSFADLLDTERFGEIFSNANVLVDFDGVVCDNIAMRKFQAKAIYQSLLDGVMAEQQIDFAQAVAMITPRIPPQFSS